MPFFYTVFARVKFSYLGFLILDHLAADGAGFPAGQVTVVAVGQVDTHFLSSLHLELIHSLLSLGNVDLIVLHSLSLSFSAPSHSRGKNLGYVRCCFAVFSPQT